MIELNGMELTIEQVIAVARHNEQVRISEPAKEKINRARAYVDEKLAQKAVIYGLTTGFGKFSNVMISSEETDFSGISVLLLEWTHGGSDDLHGVDLPVFLESSPEETRERRIRRNRDENAASPFICRVVELEQEKLEVQRKNAGLIVGKDGRVYEP